MPGFCRPSHIYVVIGILKYSIVIGMLTLTSCYHAYPVNYNYNRTEQTIVISILTMGSCYHGYPVNNTMTYNIKYYVV